MGYKTIVKNILKKLAKFLVSLAIKALFNYLDKNKDGKVDQTELNEFVDFINSKIYKK